MTRFLIRKFKGALTLNLVSSNLAIGTATTFVLMVAALSLGTDRRSHEKDHAVGAGLDRPDWQLRGSLTPTDVPGFMAPGHADKF